MGWLRDRGQSLSLRSGSTGALGKVKDSSVNASLTWILDGSSVLGNILLQVFNISGASGSHILMFRFMFPIL